MYRSKSSARGAQRMNLGILESRSEPKLAQAAHGWIVGVGACCLRLLNDVVFTRGSSDGARPLATRPAQAARIPEPCQSVL
jgi:hypothetical protein